MGASASIQNENDSALVFDNATIVLDVCTILERRWILDDFTVETLEIVVEQSTDGRWRLAGLIVEEEMNSTFQSFQSLRRISYLNLSNVCQIRHKQVQLSTWLMVGYCQNRGDSFFRCKS